MEGLEPRAEGPGAPGPEEVGHEAHGSVGEEGDRAREELRMDAHVAVRHQDVPEARVPQSGGQAVDLRVAARLPGVDDEDARDFGVAVGDPPGDGERRVVAPREGIDDFVRRILEPVERLEVPFELVVQPREGFDDRHGREEAREPRAPPAAPRRGERRRSGRVDGHGEEKHQEEEDRRRHAVASAHSGVSLRTPMPALFLNASRTAPTVFSALSSVFQA